MVYRLTSFRHIRVSHGIRHYAVSPNSAKNSKNDWKALAWDIREKYIETIQKQSDSDRKEMQRQQKEMQKQQKEMQNRYKNELKRDKLIYSAQLELVRTFLYNFSRLA